MARRPFKGTDPISSGKDSAKQKKNSVFAQIYNFRFELCPNTDPKSTATPSWSGLINRVIRKQRGFNHRTKSEQDKTNQINTCDPNGFPSTTRRRRKREGGEKKSDARRNRNTSERRNKTMKKFSLVFTPQMPFFPDSQYTCEEGSQILQGGQ